MSLAWARHRLNDLTNESFRVAVLAGLASVPVLLLYPLNAFTTIGSGPWWLTAAVLLLTPLALLLGVVLCALVGRIGGAIGGWVRTRVVGVPTPASGG